MSIQRSTARVDVRGKQVVSYAMGGAGLVAVGVITETTNDPFAVILGTGVTGAVLLLFILGLIVPRSVVTQKDAEIARLQTLFTDEVLPMVKSYTETMAQVTHNLGESNEALHTLADIQRDRLNRMGTDR
jgi:sulfite exporter TauE/SafE